MPQESVSIAEFAATQLALLAAEQAAELASAAELIQGHTPSALQRAGAALTNLTVQGRRTGSGGRTVVELGADPAVSSSTGELPEHGLRVGDVVLVAEQPAGSAKKREVRELERAGSRGVVTRVRRYDLSVALDLDDSAAGQKEEKGLNGRVWVVKLADDVTFRRSVLARPICNRISWS